MIRLFIYLTSLLISCIAIGQNDTIKPKLPKASFEIIGGLGIGNYKIKEQPNLNGNSTTFGGNIMYRVNKTIDLGIGYYATTFSANSYASNEWIEIKKVSSFVPVQARAHFDVFNTYNSPFDFYVGIGAGPNFGIRESFDNGMVSYTDKSQKTNWRMLINLGLNITLTKDSYFTINYLSFTDINKTKYNEKDRKLNSGTINLGFGLYY